MDIIKLIGILVLVGIFGFFCYFFVWSFFLAIVAHLLLWGIPVGSVFIAIIMAVSGELPRSTGNIMVALSIIFCVVWFKFDFFEKLGFEKVLDWIEKNIPIK